MHNEPTTEKIVDRVRKLLALSERAGTPEEAGTAFAQAQKLIAMHALTMEQIRQARLHDAGGTSTNEPVVKRIVYAFTSSQAPTWIGVLAYVVTEVNGCDAIYGRAYGARARELGASQDEVKYLEGWGRAGDLEIVEELLRLIVGQVEALVKRCGFSGRTALNNFRLGVVNTVCSRLRAAAKDARKAIAAAAEEQDATAPESARACTALALRVLDDRRSASTSALRGEYGGKIRSNSGSSSRVDHAARAAGRSAGATVNLARTKALR